MTAGLCECGCGERTRIATETKTAKRQVKGQPLRFINGHNGRLQGKSLESRYTEEDCGFATPCWVWTGAKTTLGYGYVRRNRELRPAHRVFYIAYRGEIPEGLHLDHLCRNRACVNPDHLEPVTCTENIRRGKNVKLDIAKAREIRRLHALGYTQRQLGTLFGVAWQTIGSVTTGRSWREL